MPDGLSPRKGAKTPEAAVPQKRLPLPDGTAHEFCGVGVGAQGDGLAPQAAVHFQPLFVRQGRPAPVGKDGRYAYKYTDAFGKVRFGYAWKLVPMDRTPSRKRDGLSLREQEKEIRKDLDDGIDTAGKKMTVCELYAKLPHSG